MGAKPKIVIADDHAGILKKVSSLLSAQFDVVAAVANGRMALEAVTEHRPDLVVLDIAMPELDGFRTARALRQITPRPRIVFLTMHADDDSVAAGLSCGALGYVTKWRLQTDLTRALELALAGYRFVSPYAFAGNSVEKQETVAATPSPKRSEHGIQFHTNEEGFLTGWTNFLKHALESNGTALVIATKSHTEQVSRRLAAHEINVDAAIATGNYVAIDVNDFLEAVILNEQPSPERLSQACEGPVDQAITEAQRNGKPVFVIGEAAPLLWTSRKPEAALRLEELVDQWTHKKHFTTFCSYPLDCFGRKSDRELLVELCGLHSFVVPAEH